MSQIADHPLKVSDPELDLAARSFWEQDFEQREKAFARLRNERPVSYSRPYESTLLPPDENTPGFWSVTKAADCRYVSRNAELFCSGKGVLMEDMPEIVITATASFLVMDGEDHRRMRGVVEQAFTRRNVKKIADWVAQIARERLDEIIDLGEGDFLVQTAITRPSGPALNYEWRVREGSNGIKIVDVIVEGVSLLVTQRSDFTSVAGQNGIDGLIATLRNKVAAL